jgi:hypothetical protein
MSYFSFMRDVPFSTEQYAEFMDGIGTEAPNGLVSHVAVRHGAGLRYIDVWRSEADWERFRDERVLPAVRAALAANGSAEPPGPFPVEVLDVVHVITA